MQLPTYRGLLDNTVYNHSMIKTVSALNRVLKKKQAVVFDSFFKFKNKMGEKFVLV